MNNHARPDPLNQIREFWGTIVLHRWSILLIAVVLAAVSVVAIALMPDSYVASTSVLFDPQKLPEKYIAPTVTADPAQRLNTLTQEVLSAGRLQQIAQDLHLYSDPRQQSPQQIVEQMRKDVTIEMKPSTDQREMNAFVISYTGPDAQLVAAVANRLAQSFIDWDLANRAQQAATTNEFLTAQLRDAAQKMETEEAKVEDYKRKHSGTLPEQLQSNMQAVSTLHVELQANEDALDRLEQEKTMLTAIPETSRPVVSVPTERDRLEAEQRALQVDLMQLRSQYTEQYPEVVTTKERLDAVTKQLSRMAPPSSATGVSSAAVRLEIIKRETDRLQEEQKSLMQRTNRYQAQVDSTAIRGQEIEYLTRSYTSARGQFESVLDKKFQAEMAGELERQQKSSRFIVDPAQVPERPIKPNRLLLLAMVLPFCGLIPAGLAVAGTEIRGTVNSERTLRSLLSNNARVVANIPMIETETGLRTRRRLAMLSILGCLTCCAAVAVFLWGGTAAHIRHNHAHRFAPSNPSAQLTPQQQKSSQQ